jgi:transcriptional regulator with XRE-family HTH domain
MVTHCQGVDIRIPLRYSHSMSISTPTAARYMATNLRETIDRQGRKVTWVAEQVGVSYALVSMIADGKRSASEDVAEAIAATLGHQVDDLFIPLKEATS